MQPGRRVLLLGLTALPFYPKSPLLVLSPHEASQVEILVDCIVPGDDSPGAREAGVLYYIDKQLAGPLARFAGQYRSGLASLASQYETSHRQQLSLASRAETTAWLKEVETNGGGSDRAFFRLLVEHTMQGFYGAPANGGNRNEASWRMLGVDGVLGGHSH